MASAHDNDPICGDCEMPKSQHFHEGKIWYCNQVTNGDVFTDHPSDANLLAYMEFEDPALIETWRDRWKREHGHRG